MRKLFIITFFYIISINCFAQTEKTINETIEILLKKADILFDLKKYEEVYSTYEKAINLNPENIKTLVARGKFLIQYNKHELGENDLNKALKLAKDKDEKCYVYAISGAMFGFIQQNKKSYELLNKAIVCDPSNINILISLGAVSSSLGKDEEAIKYLQKALEIDSTNYMIYGNLGFIYQEQEKFEDAIITFKKALKYNPEEPQTLGNLAFNEYKLGQLESALKNINKSIKLYPQNSYSYRTRAMIFLNKGEKAKACENIQIALEKNYTKLYGDGAIQFKKENCNN